MKDLHPVGALLKSILGSMGLERVELTLTLMEEWDDIAGSPWVGASNPIVVKDGDAAQAASSQEIRRAVHQVFEGYGQEGGYIMSACDHFFETPPDNREAFAAAARECVY